MYERLLVPIDGSSFSRAAIPHALGIARATGVGLTLLRVVDGEHARAEAAQALQGLATEVGGEARCLPVSGDVAATIMAEAERLPGTLIVMNSHGRSGVLEAVLGSVAMKLLRIGHEPVLLFRPPGNARDEGLRAAAIDRVVLPLDGTPLSEAMAPQAARFAHWLGARLVVVTAVRPDSRSPEDVPRSDIAESSYVRSRAEDLARRHGVQVGWEVLHGDPTEAIVDFVGQQQGSVLAMATRGNTALRTSLLGSVTAGCVRRSGVPILAASHTMRTSR